MQTTLAEPQNYEPLKRIHNWYRQILPNILPYRNLMSSYPHQSSSPMADKTTELGPIAEEFCPNFNVYLYNGTKALHIKLQHPTPTIDGLGTHRNEPHKAHEDLRSLAAHMLQGNNAKVPEQAST